ncbi:tyrosine-type recombinase/integrase [bacterium]|nr:tyrosine-type recombinase/integrase [bacterium]
MSNHKSTELYFTDKGSSLLQTMPDYVKTYIRAIHNRTSPRTRYEYLKDIQAFLNYIESKFHIKNPKIDDLKNFKKVDFEEYFEYLEHYIKDYKERTNSRVSIKRKLSSLRKFFGYLFENEILPSDEIRKVEMPKIHKKEIIRLESDEVVDFINAVEKGNQLTKKQNDYHKIQSIRDTALIFLMLSTGIRVSECAELDINDVDMNRCSLHIVRKGGDEATVYFSDEAAEYLSDWLEYRKRIPNLNPDEKALFLSSRKSRISVRAIEVLVKKYAQRSIPLKKITPHKLRSTFATNLYNETGDIYLVAETLGHKDVTTTKEHYANLSNQRKEENRNKVTFKNHNVTP